MTSQTSSDSTQVTLSNAEGHSASTEDSSVGTSDGRHSSENPVDDAENTEETDNQASLTDISYEGHTAAQPPEARVTSDSISYEEFFEQSVGDVIWVDGTEYVVVERPFTLIGPTPLGVVSRDGNQGELVAGKVPNSSSDGVAWRSTLAAKESNNEISRSDLICGYDRLCELERDSLEHVHDWTPDTDSRKCPACERGMSGEPLRIERQASKVVELRKCKNTDCHFKYRFVREFPEGRETTVVTYDSNNDHFGLESVSGVFTCEEQDDFKFPIETNKGRDDGFYTASEIAEFINPKLTDSSLTALLEDEDTTGEEVLSSLELVTSDESFSSLDVNDEECSTRAIESLGELLEDYVDDRQIPFTDSLESAVKTESVSFTDFYRAMVFLRNAVADQPEYQGQNVEPGLDVEPEKAVSLAVVTLVRGDVVPDDDVPETVMGALRDAFTAELTVERVLSSTVFKELLEDHVEHSTFGVVDIDRNRAGQRTIEWRDYPGYEKNRRVTFTEFEENSGNMQKFRWNLRRNDLSEIVQ